MLSELFTSWWVRQVKDPKEVLLIMFKSHSHSDTFPPALPTTQRFYNSPTLVLNKGPQPAALVPSYRLVPEGTGATVPGNQTLNIASNQLLSKQSAVALL